MDKVSTPLEGLWEVAAEASEDAVFGIDAGGLVVAWKTSAARLFGYTAAEMLGLILRSKPRVSRCAVPIGWPESSLTSSVQKFESPSPDLIDPPRPST